MSKIIVNIIAGDDLTIFTVTGSLTKKDIMQFSTDYYIKIPTKNVLWDARNGTVLDISPDEFKDIAKSMKEIAGFRKGGKTAFVGGGDAGFSLGKMYETFALIENLPVRYRVFEDIEDAKKWIFEKETDDEK